MSVQVIPLQMYLFSKRKWVGESRMIRVPLQDLFKDANKSKRLYHCRHDLSSVTFGWCARHVRRVFNRGNLNLCHTEGESERFNGNKKL